MGEMADMALYDCMINESYADDYVSGDMSKADAYEHGFIDEIGIENPHIQSAWHRSTFLMSNSERYRELEVLDLQLSLSSFSTNKLNEPIGIDVISVVDGVSKKIRLNEKGYENLRLENPTCNICHQQMTPRNGVYGKFYFCSNQCDGQKTVSDKYWQSIKI